MGWEIWSKIKSTLVDPDKLFKKIDQEVGIANAIIWLLCAIILNLVIKTGILALMLMGFPEGSLLSAIMMYGVNILATFIGTFIAVLVLHLSIKLFKGASDISTTFKILAYSLAPYFILSFIPYIGVFAISFSIFLTI